MAGFTPVHWTRWQMPCIIGMENKSIYTDSIEGGIFMRRRILLLGLILCMMLTLCVPHALAAGYPPYELDLEYVPKWGEGDYIAGQVLAGGATVYYEGLFVKAFLQVEGSDVWWAKPTDIVPYVPVFGGRFVIGFNTGGDDIHARRICLMLVRSRDARLLDFEQANAAALCTVTIDRSPSGEIALSHSYRDDYAHADDFSMDIGMNIGFYTQPGTAPGDPLTEAHIEAILRAAAACAKDVRFYSTTGETAKAYSIARTLGLQVAATAWLDGSEHDQAELDALIWLCNEGFAGTAVVGNETQYANRLSEEALLKDIAYVRAGIYRSGIPVTTADTLDTFLNSPKLRDACDVLAVNIYPFWSGAAPMESSVEEALSGATEKLYELVGDKPIIVSETGWPTEGAETAGFDGQCFNLGAAQMLTSMWVFNANVVRVYWFSLADEPWKEADEPGVGPHWGALDKDLNVKPAALAMLWDCVGEDTFATELDGEWFDFSTDRGMADEAETP